MRKTIQDLVSPVADRTERLMSKHLKYKAMARKHQEKLTLLEATVFKNKDASTRFDDIERGIEDSEMKIKRSV